MFSSFPSEIKSIVIYQAFEPEPKNPGILELKKFARPLYTFSQVNKEFGSFVGKSLKEAQKKYDLLNKFLICDCFLLDENFLINIFKNIKWRDCRLEFVKNYPFMEKDSSVIKAKKIPNISLSEVQDIVAFEPKCLTAVGKKYLGSLTDNLPAFLQACGCISIPIEIPEYLFEAGARIFPKFSCDMNLNDLLKGESKAGKRLLSCLFFKKFALIKEGQHDKNSIFSILPKEIIHEIFKNFKNEFVASIMSELEKNH